MYNIMVGKNQYRITLHERYLDDLISLAIKDLYNTNYKERFVSTRVKNEQIYRSEAF